MITLHYIFSEEKCRESPEECRDIIPYTTHSNRLYGLNSTEEYSNFTDAIRASLEQCTIDPYLARWGACYIIYPRCLLGWELQFCRKSCLGLYNLLHVFIFK